MRPSAHRERPHMDFLRREIHRIRVEQGVSIEALSTAAGYANHAHVSRWLAGAGKVDLAVSRIVLMLDALGYELALANK